MRTRRTRGAFRRREDGVVAIEFAFVAPVFLLILFGLFEYSFFVWKRSVMRNVVFEASRSIQTGDVQKNGAAEAGSTQAYFKRIYCDRVPPFLNCENVYFDVRSYAALRDASFPPAEFGTDYVPTNFVFDPGEQEDVVTIRAAVRHDFVFGSLREIFQPNDDPVIVLGYSVFRNEPFGPL